MEILVSGSLAIDRIMTFNGRFGDHIVPERLDRINLSFTVDGFNAYFGGTAGNIAYSLAMLGERPRIIAAIGADYRDYFTWLGENGIPTDDIRIVGRGGHRFRFYRYRLGGQSDYRVQSGGDETPGGF